MTLKLRDVGGVHAVNGIATKLDTSDVTTPTAAELIAAFGPASANAGKIFINDDNNAGTTLKVIICNGTDYFFSASYTKAT